MIEIVRKALGRAGPLETAPVPPVIPDAIARLVGKDVNLVEHFVRSAVDAKFQLARVSAGEIGEQLVGFLRENQCKTVGIPASELIDRLGLEKAMRDNGVRVLRWGESTLDAAYDLDCCVTDVYSAVAETGSLVIKPSAGHGRALSLVPAIYIAIVEAASIVADLIDLLEKVAGEPRVPNITLITGPSKTADIEGVLVTGVHGPGVVQIYLLV
jgi:L-lactate utilization protein LutC